MSRPSARAAAAAGAVVAGLVAYGVRLNLNPLEVLRWAIGALLLWGPVAALVYVAVRREVAQPIPRLTFALIASYTLTTLLYFLCCVAWSPALFYAAQCAIAATVIAVVARGGARSLWRRRQPVRPDWPLLVLVVISLLLFSRYQIPHRTDPATGDVRIVACLEQTYFCGQAYELARATPPQTQACQAGVPERAYHLLPHLAAMLNARFAGLADVMHAHLAYHYAMLAVLTCLALFSIGERLANSKAAGYVAVCFFVVFAIPLPPLVASQLGYFYFSPFPLASSFLEPVVVTSPQMFSGLVVMFGVLLGVLLMCRQVTAADDGTVDNRRCGALAIVCALMVAAMCRFRIQVFLPLAPGFFAILPYFWLRGRSRRSVALAAVLAVAVSAALYFETRWPGYLRGTAGIRIGFAPSEPAYLKDLPFYDRVNGAFRWLLSDAAYPLIWPVVNTLAFTLLNVIGLPLLAATAWCLCPRSTWRQWGPFAALAVWLVLASLLGALFIQSGYDSFSVGGQMLLHTGWYLLPFLGLAVWRTASWVASRLALRPRTCALLGAGAIAAAVVVQVSRPPSPLDRTFAKLSILLPRNDWLAIRYLHDHTPPDAVVISDHHLEPAAAVYPGLAGRAAYLSYVRNTTGLLPAAGPKPDRSRLDTINDLWAERNPARFVSLLTSTGATHLVEFSDHRLNMGPRKFLRQVWESPAAADANTPRVRIYRYQPQFWQGVTAASGQPKTNNPQGAGS